MCIIMHSHLLLEHDYDYAGIFYYQLGNLSPYLRSQLKSIQLLAIAKAPVVVKYGSDTILEPFMQDLKMLEQVS